MAAFDMDDPEAIVSPGGVGFDINCGVRLLRTNLDEKDVSPVKEELAQSLFDHIPVGVGSKGVIPMNAKDLEEALEMGMDWSLREGCVASPRPRPRHIHNHPLPLPCLSVFAPPRAAAPFLSARACVCLALR